MEVNDKSKKQLLEEIKELRRRCRKMEALESKHLELEKSLKESNQKLSILIEHLPGMGYARKNDPDWTMETVSSGCFELTGYKPEELIGNRAISYNEIIHPHDLQYVRGHVQEALGKKEAWHLLYRIKTASGQEKWVWERGVGVFSDEDEFIWLQGFITSQAG